MPLIQIFTSATPEPVSRKALLSELSGALAKHFGKPEQYVMTCLVPGLSMTFSGTPAPTCFAAVKNIGKLTPDKSRELSSDLCASLAKGLGVPQDRIYIEFTDAVGYLWGHDGDTFG
jgi:phenylpyruvate tautomerase PptA (4-oxalocrotonate tautomerase family)